MRKSTRSIFSSFIRPDDNGSVPTPWTLGPTLRMTHYLFACDQNGAVLLGRVFCFVFGLWGRSASHQTFFSSLTLSPGWLADWMTDWLTDRSTYLRWSNFRVLVCLAWRQLQVGHPWPKLLLPPYRGSVDAWAEGNYWDSCRAFYLGEVTAIFGADVRGSALRDISCDELWAQNKLMLQYDKQRLFWFIKIQHGWRMGGNNSNSKIHTTCWF